VANERTYTNDNIGDDFRRNLFNLIAEMYRRLWYELRWEREGRPLLTVNYDGAVSSY